MKWLLALILISSGIVFATSKESKEKHEVRAAFSNLLDSVDQFQKALLVELRGNPKTGEKGKVDEAMESLEQAKARVKKELKESEKEINQLSKEKKKQFQKKLAELRKKIGELEDSLDE
ncbi:MAG: hypothetical protein CL676_09665 [Bdellovibrionaceae bacterium]|nr:hypothetical protein [Pseudobdellovibrionaceae bacterium]|tara:strand:+ start:887 stop:1243 length:357 start_codon:yes stop_codon:yes gene_type:complete